MMTDYQAASSDVWCEAKKWMKFLGEIYKQSKNLILEEVIWDLHFDVVHLHFHFCEVSE